MCRGVELSAKPLVSRARQSQIHIPISGSSASTNLFTQLQNDNNRKLRALLGEPKKQTRKVRAGALQALSKCSLSSLSGCRRSSHGRLCSPTGLPLLLVRASTRTSKMRACWQKTGGLVPGPRGGAGDGGGERRGNWSY